MQLPLCRFVYAPSICAGQERWLVYFALFLDESGKTHQRGFAALCGFVATMDEWAQFGNAWTNLQLKWDVPPIHMSRIMARIDSDKQDKWTEIQKKMGDDWIDWRDTVIDDFAQLIVSSNVAAIGGVLETAAYRAIRAADPEDFLITHADCNVYLLQNALMQALDKIEIVDKSGMLSVCIDDDEDHAIDYYTSYWTLQRMIGNPKIPPEQKQRFERIPRRVDQISFCKDTFHPALQAADMLAYASRRFKAEQVETEKEDVFGPLYNKLTRGRTHLIKDYREKNLREIAGNTAREIRMDNEEN